MKIGVYVIIDDPFPKLHKIMDINAKANEFEDDESMVEVLNRELRMDKLDVEHTYAVALTDTFYPLGIILCSIGTERENIHSNRTMAIGLLLLGAERFSLFHNHPHDLKGISDDDIETTEKVEIVAALFGLQFDNHIMITKDYFNYCVAKGYSEQTLTALEKLKALANK